MPGLALNVAATSLVGQALGSWQPQEARLRGNTAMLLGTGGDDALATPIVVFAPSIIRLFDPSAHPVLLRTGTTYFPHQHGRPAAERGGDGGQWRLRGAGDSVPGLISTVFARALIAVRWPIFWRSCWAWVRRASGSAWLSASSWTPPSWAGAGAAAPGCVWPCTTEVYRQHLHHLPEDVQQAICTRCARRSWPRRTWSSWSTREGVTYRSPARTVRVTFHGGRLPPGVVAQVSRPACAVSRPHDVERILRDLVIPAQAGIHRFCPSEGYATIRSIVTNHLSASCS